MTSKFALSATIAAAATFGLAACGPSANAPDPIKRGEYLVKVISCNDCHTPGVMMGQPDMSKFLAGSNIGFFVPDLGYFYGSNLTPDKETGLGNWSADEIVTALRTGTRPDGRKLAPSMPWMAFANLSDEDAHAIAAYLRSLPPISNKVPGPFGAQEAPTSFYSTILPPPAAQPSPPAADGVPAQN
jgi:mono/diheme cytochrome c family protein